MDAFKDSKYYMSDEHIKNSKNALIKGRLKIQKLKKERIEEYYKQPKLCKECEKPISYEKKNLKVFCDSSCSAKYNNKNRNNSFITDDLRKKASIKRIETYYKKVEIENKINIYEIEILCDECSKPLTKNQKMRKNKYCSNLCSLKNKKQSQETKDKISSKIKERIKNGTHKGWMSRKLISYPERFFIEVFNNKNILFKFNFPINKRNDLNLDDSSNYFLDFYFEDKKIDLEIDGNQHERRKEHDKLRDENLSKIGIYVYRIKWLNINSEKGKLYIKKEINDFLIFMNNLGVSP
jgi:hypothetical protein